MKRFLDRLICVILGIAALGMLAFLIWLLATQGHEMIRVPR